MAVPLDQTSHSLTYRVIVWTFAVHAIVSAALAILGWTAGLYRLTDWTGTGINMKFNAALCSLAAGLAVAFLQWPLRFTWVARTLALLVALIGGLTLLEHLTGRDLAIDALWFDEPHGVPGTVAPGRMGPPASSSFLLLGSALLLVTAGPRARRLASFLATIVACIVGISLTGYIFGANVLFSLARSTAIAMQTATIIMALALSVLLLVPEYGIVATLRRRDAGGILARRMIIPLVVLPLGLGWLVVHGQSLGLYDTAFGTAMFAFLLAACLGAIMFKTADRVGSADEALRHADRRKDDFLATLAHELRNPLAPIRHGVEIMKRPGNSPQALEELRANMDRQLAHMVRLIDDLLDVSRITQDRLLLRRERVELGSVLRQAIETAQPGITAARHQLRANIPPQPIYLDADPVRLVQIFGNLLNNACKYTEPGGKIEVDITRNDDDALVTVRDTGIGIPHDMLESVFDMFTQVQKHQKSSEGGLGIGLSLARRLVELHGGQISARSPGLGKGSEFLVTLPILAGLPEPQTPAVTAAPAAQAPKPTPSARRILVVDDNRDAARSLAKLLNLDGHETLIAHDGAEGVAKALDYKPDVLLLDIGMPEMDGYDACRTIRNQPWGTRIKIIALTGWGQQEDRRKSRDAGFDEHLVKPVDYATLRELLARILVT